MEAHDGSEELDDAGIDKACSEDVNDDLAGEMDDDTNDGGTMKLCRGSEIYQYPDFVDTRII
ncbi:hypothetical protein P692DRAFT_20757224 [Suillus brevipes Sb2]|nr:hypothetical protein P692DRAFT_20757224 [Suillus brevipes Sb2]